MRRCRIADKTRFFTDRPGTPAGFRTRSRNQQFHRHALSGGAGFKSCAKIAPAARSGLGQARAARRGDKTFHAKPFGAKALPASE